MRTRLKALITVALLGLLVGLPLAGVIAAHKPIGQYLHVPPLTLHYVHHAGFLWPAFIALALFIAVFVLPFVIRLAMSQASAARPEPLLPPPRPFPWWGWFGLAFGAAAWTLAWTRFPWFAPLQTFTFSPLWFAYILVINALTFRRSHTCMLTARPGYFAALFPLSAAFWWFFEYLNRFVQNWYYVGIGDLSPLQYFVFATLPFSTVLPAVLGTFEWLSTFPRLTAGLNPFMPLGRPEPIPGNLRTRVIAGMALLLFAAGLAGIGVWPDYLFPLLWISPLAIITSLQAMAGVPTLFAPIRRGNWTRIVLLALSALVCGFFWEMWNFYSQAKWIYAVPFVGRFHLFEMPILGYAGYLPFGFECAVVAALLEPQAAAPAAPKPRTLGRMLVALPIAAALWLPCLHFFFQPKVSDYVRPDGIAPKAQAIAANHLALWATPEQRQQEILKMRSSNAEWDFMGRTYLVLSLANMGLRSPADKPTYLPVMDQIIDETVRLEREKGIYYFLMDYARDGKWKSKGQRSIFQDGEIALMIAARRMLEEREEYRPLLAERVRLMLEAMRESPVLCAESYPNECWMFCNTVALASIRMADVLDGTDHSDFLNQWLAVAKQKLVDPKTGILVSSFAFNGNFFDGPEGSSIWMAAHCLQVVDRTFAEDQYARAKKELARRVLGFGYAKEWPASWVGPADVDSGPVIPVFDISAGSSGLAFLGAGAFGDLDYFRDLLTSLNFGGFPVHRDGRLRYCAANQVGDAVLLYSMVQGPLWREVDRRGGRAQ